MSLENDWKTLLNSSENNMGGEKVRYLNFGAFRIDLTERELFRSGDPVPLTIKAFDVLAHLVQNAGHTVTKDELMKVVWPDSFVEEANVTRIVHTLRKALGDEENEHQLIRTIPKRGYRFVGEVRTESPEDSEAWPSTIEESEKRDSRTYSRRYVLMASAAGILLIAVAVIAFTFSRNDNVKPASKPISIAVLPFRPIDQEKRDLVYDLAFANALIAGLNQSKGLRVRSLATIRGYTDVTQDPLAIGKEQIVDYVLESNYLSVNGRLQVTSNLIDVNTGSVDATLKYDAGDGELYAAGRKIAAKLVPGLLAKLGLGPVTLDNRGTESEIAWKSYLQGMILANKRSVEDARKAIPEFENAIKADPNWAQGYVGLDHAMNTIMINGGGIPDLCSRSLANARRALELDPTNGEAYMLMASNIQYCTWDVPAANQARQRSLELAPNSALVRRYYAVNIMNQQRFDEALENLNIARELEPTVTWNEKLIGRVLYYARRYDESIEQNIKSKDIDPEFEQTSFIYKAYELKGDLDKAMEWFLVVESLRKDNGPADLEEWKAVYTESGWQGVLRKRLERAVAAERSAEKAEEKANAYAYIATLFVQLGDYDNAFPYIEKAVDNYPLFAAQIKVDPYMDPIRSDPRYAAIMARTWDRSGN